VFEVFAKTTSLLGNTFEMRMLYVVPIVHSPEDLGTLADVALSLRRSLVSDTTCDASQAAVRRFWADLTDTIESWNIHYASLTVYQDALPVCEAALSGVEQQIIDELASKGSRNHQILQWLRSQGAMIVGTESPALLIEEYQLMKESMMRELEGDESPSAASHRSGQVAILRSRDKFIANRIDQTLRDSQTGLIFLGLIHQLEEHLPNDVLTVYPFGRPVLYEQSRNHYRLRTD
jgi:hypothetical protein